MKNLFGLLLDVTCWMIATFLLYYFGFTTGAIIVGIVGILYVGYAACVLVDIWSRP